MKHYPMPTAEMQTELGGWRAGRISILDGDIEAQHDFAAVAAESVPGNHRLVGSCPLLAAAWTFTRLLPVTRNAFVVIDHIEINDAYSYRGFHELLDLARDRWFGLLLCLHSATGIPGSVADNIAVMRLVVERVDGALEATVAKWKTGPTGGKFRIPLPDPADHGASWGV